MTTMVEPVLAAARTAQAALLLITGLQLTGYMWPQSATVEDGASFDFIIVGGGTAGCVLANRLTERSSFNVLLIEAGGDPPLESVLPGLFSLLPQSATDYNFTSENDGYSAQNTKRKVVELTAGKMLGGSSGLHHFIHVRGNPYDYAKWADAAHDQAWNYWNLLPYFLKSEKVEDYGILTSPNSEYIGINGYVRLTKQPSDDNILIFKAFDELGHRVILNINNPFHTVGVLEPLLYIADGVRQSAAESYLRPIANRPNFHLLKNTQVTKILFDDQKNAIGVNAVTSDSKTITIKANLEVLLTAGVFETPKLLMLSGIGPDQHLSSLGIPVISNLPVGQNLQDHVPAAVVHTLAPGKKDTTPADPHRLPVSITTGYTALDIKQPYPDYQTINLIISPDSDVLIHLCSLVISYKNEICQGFVNSGKGKSILYTIHNILNAESKGEVLLRSTNPSDAPKVNLGTYSNQKDLRNMALYLEDFSRIVDTAPFKRMEAKLVDVDLPECNHLERGTYNYWKCYALSMSSSMWHFCGTSSMGPVLDSQLKVKGVQRLRVADASAMPNPISGNINAAVVALAEKAADLIKDDYRSRFFSYFLPKRFY